jgi:hypothetical protein
VVSTEPVERQLGAQLLRDADQRVGDKHDAEQGVLRLAGDQDHGQQDTEDEVEPGQDIRAQDLSDRPTGWWASLPAFVSPRGRRSATCALVKPVSGVFAIGAGDAGGAEAAA